jgi:hypothetical protein
MSSTDFQIHARLVTDEGDFDEEAAEQFEDDLTELFASSPEWRALAAEGVELRFARAIIQYLRRYEDVSPAEMTDIQFETVIFEIFPEKFSIEPTEARAIILEARAFCRYLARAYGLENARAALATVEGDDAVEALEAALSNPENWGMAKSVVMQAKARGFDFSSEEGVEKWMASYEGSLLPSLSRRAHEPRIAANRKTNAARRKKRKQQKAARRKNR